MLNGLVTANTDVLQRVDFSTTAFICSAGNLLEPTIRKGTSLTGNGSTANPLAVKLSTDAGNTTVFGTDGGVFTPATPFNVVDTNCIDLTLTGTNLSADPIISPAILGVNNSLTCTATGMYVPVGAGLTVTDTSCIDLTLTSAANLSAVPIISPTIGVVANALTCVGTGLYVPTAANLAVTDTCSIDLTLTAAGDLSADFLHPTGSIDTATNLLGTNAAGCPIQFLPACGEAVFGDSDATLKSFMPFRQFGVAADLATFVRNYRVLAPTGTNGNTTQWLVDAVAVGTLPTPPFVLPTCLKWVAHVSWRYQYDVNFVSTLVSSNIFFQTIPKVNGTFDIANGAGSGIMAQQCNRFYIAPFGAADGQGLNTGSAIYNIVQGGPTALEARYIIGHLTLGDVTQYPELRFIFSMTAYYEIMKA